MLLYILVNPCIQFGSSLATVTKLQQNSAVGRSDASVHSSSAVASVSASRRCIEGQCSCDSARTALAIESLVVDRRREAAAAVGSSHRAAALCLPSVSLVAAVHAHRTQFSRSQREGMHGPAPPPPSLSKRIRFRWLLSFQQLILPLSYATRT